MSSQDFQQYQDYVWEPKFLVHQVADNAPGIVVKYIRVSTTIMYLCLRIMAVAMLYNNIITVILNGFPVLMVACS